MKRLRQVGEVNVSRRGWKRWRHRGSDTACGFRDFGIWILGAKYCVGCGLILIENREGFFCHFTSFLD